MKNTRAVVMIAISVIIGLAAVVLASNWVRQQGSMTTSKVVVAAKDMDLGTRLLPESITTVEWPRGSIPQGALMGETALGALLKDPQTQEPRVLKVSVLKGEAILEPKLAPIGTKGGLSAVIGEGKRAITVRVNDVVGVAGFALPGNYVDILVNTEDENAKSANKNDKSISKIVLEHILVLAVAQESGRDETKPKVVNAVTLEVSPDQAEKLDLARSIGTLSLVLRNQVDSSPVTTEGIYKRDLLNRTPEPVIASQTQGATKVIVKKVFVTRTQTTAKAPTKEKVDMIKGMAQTSSEF
ncbi:MAG: Flp pilus assembly protein CpaB [Proteobacteria bacterium]|nr:Flp pilus assembly protein CpaB [Pseudomonadota bacterium]